MIYTGAYQVQVESQGAGPFGQLDSASVYHRVFGSDFWFGDGTHASLRDG